MKHVFIIHSNITYLVALSVIRLKKLNDYEVLFAITRNYTIPSSNPYRKFALNDGFNFSSNLIVNYLKLKKWQNALNRNIDETFHAYLPHTNNSRFAMIVDNSKCSGYSYLEEGLGYYMHENVKVIKRSKFENLKNLLKYSSWRLVNLLENHKHFCFTDNKYSESFVLNLDAIPTAPNKILINIGFESQKKEQSHLDCIIIFDALALFNILKREQLIDLLNEYIIPHIKKSSYKNTAFKLHPEHYASVKGNEEAILLREILKSNFTNILELEKDYVLEEYLQNKRTVLYTYVSSLGYYASLWGSEVYGLHSRLSKCSNYFNFKENILSKYTQL